MPYQPSYDEDSNNMTDRQTKNIQKILQIQSLLVSGKAFGAVYPALLDLASRDRIFLNECDLRKVCRKQNVLYHFWLFNDCLIYGLALETGKYLFHRKIDLITCSVAAYRSLVYKHALEISAEERSFIVMAANSYEQMQWLNAMLGAISAVRATPLSVSELIHATGLPSNTARSLDATSSPFWNEREAQHIDPRKSVEKAKNGALVCVICSETFGVFNRRYECSNCGSSVCLEHSTREISVAHQQQGMTMDHYRTCQGCCTDANDQEKPLTPRALLKPTPPPRTPPPKPQRSIVTSDLNSPEPYSPSFAVVFNTSTSAFSAVSNATSPQIAPTVVSTSPVPWPKASAASLDRPGPVEIVAPISTSTTDEAAPCPFPPSPSRSSSTLDEPTFQQRLAATKVMSASTTRRPSTPSTNVPGHKNVDIGYISTIKEPKLGKEEQEVKDQKEAAQMKRQASFRVSSARASVDEGDVHKERVDKAPEAAAHRASTDRDQYESAKRNQPASPRTSQPATPALNVDDSASRVRVASQIFTEKLDAINKKANATSEPPVNKPPFLTGTSNRCMSPVRSLSRENSQHLTPSPSPRNASSGSLASTPDRSFAKHPATHGSPVRQPSNGSLPSLKKGQSSVGQRISQFNSSCPAPTYVESKISPLSQTYPAARVTRSDSPDSDENVGTLVLSPPRRAPSPFTRADPSSQKQVSSDIRSSKSYRTSSCEITDTDRRREQPLEGGRCVSRSSVSNGNIVANSIDSLSSTTTVESKTSTSTVTYMYQYDVDTDEDEPGVNRLRKPKTPFPESDVRSKMEEDGVSQEDISEFLSHLAVHTKESQAPPPTILPVCDVKEPVVSISPTASGTYCTYDKMRSMRIPEGAVRQKMMCDGISVEEVDAYFSSAAVGSFPSTPLTSRSPPPPPPPPSPPIEVKYTYASVPAKGRVASPTMAPTQAMAPTPAKKREPTIVTQPKKGGAVTSGASIKEISACKKSPPKIIESPVEKKKENPVSRLFASIRSGVTLKPKTDEEVDVPKKGSSTMHSMLSSALQSRRNKANLETFETFPSVESVGNLDDQ